MVAPLEPTGFNNIKGRSTRFIASTAVRGTNLPFAALQRFRQLSEVLLPCR